jgi:hypothetical protein
MMMMTMIISPFGQFGCGRPLRGMVVNQFITTAVGTHHRGFRQSTSLKVKWYLWISPPAINANLAPTPGTLRLPVGDGCCLYG